MAGVDMDLVVRKQAEVEARSNFQDVPFMKFKEDGPYPIRILPPHGESRQFWMEFQKAFKVGPNQKHLVPLAQFGQDCPLQKRIEELNKAGDELSKKEAQKMRPKSRVSMVVIDRKNEAQGPCIFETNLDVFRDILTIMSDPDFGDITHPDSGTDLTISYVKEGRTGFAEWSPQPRRNPSKLSDNPELQKAWTETDWMTAGNVGKASEAGYIEAVLESKETRRGGDVSTNKPTIPSPYATGGYAATPAAPPPLAAIPPTTPVVPVVTRKFLAGTKFWDAVSGCVSNRGCVPATENRVAEV